MSNHKVLFSKAKPPLAIAAACQLCKFNAMFVPSGVSSPELRLASGDLLKGEGTIARYIARNAPSAGLYVTHSADALAAAEVDQWIEFADKELSADTEATFTVLDAQLALRTYLAGRCISLADLTAWQVLKRSPTFTAEFDRVAASSFTAESKFPRLVRWFRFLETIPELQKGIQALSGGPPRPAAATTEAESSKASSQGSFEIELPGAEEGKVVTRFPPEPSGFLHVGHAKAALLNDYYARRFKGKLILRFDDTNPSKEKEDFVVNIFRDLDTLGIKPDVVSYSSDYFDLCLQMCEKMLKEGKAYVDDTPVEKMRAERMNGIESEKRSAPVEENLSLWKEMVQATERGLSCCVRAKMDMQALNKAMRDPVMYRCNLTPHHRTGDKYKLYPTYDFCCPIVDSVEGVTHALRTSEYHDRNDQYYWFCDAMGIRKPHIWDYSRLNFVYTLLSKRKLQFFVDKGIVGGWDDPRFPTVQGIMRRGLRIEALREFILGLGASKALNLMEWDKIWTINKKFIDPIVPRYTAITANDRVLVELTDGPSTVEARSLPRHKKNADLGRKVVNFYKFVWLEYEDVAACKEGEEVTLMDWGNAILDKIEKDEQGKPVRVVAHLNLAGNFKTTEKKLTWLSNVEDDLVSVKMVDYDYLITKKKLEEEDNFENFINPTTLYETLAVGDPNLRNLQRGETIQLERKGYFVCDQVYLRPGNPVILLNIPDGRARAVPLKPVFGAVPAK